MDTIVQPIDASNLSASITTEGEGNHQVSCLEGLPIGGDTPESTTTQQRNNCDLMARKSRPTGRPGPFVSEAAKQEAMDWFQRFDLRRNEWSRTEEKVFHVSEFSSTGEKLFFRHVTEQELADQLKKPQSDIRFRLLFATSQNNNSAIYSTYTQHVLSACGAPVPVLPTLMQGPTSPFYFFTDTRDGDPVFHGWMALRVQWRPFKGSLELLSEPYYSHLKDKMSFETITLFPKLYFSYNAGTRQTTIITTDLDQLYLRMVQHLETLSKMADQPDCPGQMVQLLTQCFAVVRESFGATAVHWDNRATGGEMASQTLETSDDHNDRVRIAETFSRVVDRTRSDFVAFQAALTTLEKRLQELWSTLDLPPTSNESFGALFTEQRELCEVTRYLLDGLVNRYDRYLTLLLNYTNIRMVEGMKNVSEQNARQAQSMAALAYDTKRDSEVMKAITVVTILFLPATFVSSIFSMGFFKFDHDRLELSQKGWIYLVCTFPITSVVLGASFWWIWWTGKKEERPSDYSSSQAPAQITDTLGLGAGPRKDTV